MTSKVLYGAENMKKFSLKQLSLIAGILATVSFILRIIALLSFHEYSGYYQKGAILPIISNTVFAISIIFALVATMVFVKKDHSIPLPSNISNYCAILPIAAAIFHISRILMLPYNDLAVNKYLMIIACALSAAYFFMIFINKAKETVTVYLGIGACFYFFLNWVFVYFNFSSPINSVDRIFFYFACAGAILFIFNEICACFGCVKPKFYFFSVFCAILTISVSSLASIIASGEIAAYNWLESDISLLSVMIYAIVRLVTVLFKKENTASPEITAENDEKCE